VPGRSDPESDVNPGISTRQAEEAHIQGPDMNGLDSARLCASYN
jgi:hypothetical protein